MEEKFNFARLNNRSTLSDVVETNLRGSTYSETEQLYLAAYRNFNYTMLFAHQYLLYFHTKANKTQKYC